MFLYLKHHLLAQAIQNTLIAKMDTMKKYLVTIMLFCVFITALYAARIISSRSWYVKKHDKNAYLLLSIDTVELFGWERLNDYYYKWREPLYYSWANRPAMPTRMYMRSLITTRGFNNHHYDSTYYYHHYLSQTPFSKIDETSKLKPLYVKVSALTDEGMRKSYMSKKEYKGMSKRLNLSNNKSFFKIYQGDGNSTNEIFDWATISNATTTTDLIQSLEKRLREIFAKPGIYTIKYYQNKRALKKGEEGKSVIVKDVTTETASGSNAITITTDYKQSVNVLHIDFVDKKYVKFTFIKQSCSNLKKIQADKWEDIKARALQHLNSLYNSQSIRAEQEDIEERTISLIREIDGHEYASKIAYSFFSDIVSDFSIQLTQEQQQIRSELIYCINTRKSLESKTLTGLKVFNSVHAPLIKQSLAERWYEIDSCLNYHSIAKINFYEANSFNEIIEEIDGHKRNIQECSDKIEDQLFSVKALYDFLNKHSDGNSKELNSLLMYSDGIAQSLEKDLKKINDEISKWDREKEIKIRKESERNQALAAEAAARAAEYERERPERERREREAREREEEAKRRVQELKSPKYWEPGQRVRGGWTTQGICAGNCTYYVYVIINDFNSNKTRFYGTVESIGEHGLFIKDKGRPYYQGKELIEGKDYTFSTSDFERP